MVSIAFISFISSINGKGEYHPSIHPSIPFSYALNNGEKWIDICESF